jgi:hypothetical protein
MRSEAIALVAGLRANSSIPFSVIPRIIESFGHMTTSLTSCFQSIAESSLSEAGLDVSSAQSVQQIMCHKLQMCEKPVEFLSTVYKQDKYFAQHDLYVEPESVCFGARYESHSGTNKLVYDSYQYVSS